MGVLFFALLLVLVFAAIPIAAVLGTLSLVLDELLLPGAPHSRDW